MPIRTSVAAVLEAFQQLGTDPSIRDVARFIADNFQEPGSDLDVVTPSDWSARPPLLLRIKDETQREWALQLNAIWKQLGRYDQSLAVKRSGVVLTLSLSLSMTQEGIRSCVCISRSVLVTACAQSVYCSWWSLP
jgi:hypothetical protein